MAVFSTVDLVQLDRQPLCSLFLASPYLSLASGLGCAVRWCQDHWAWCGGRALTKSFSQELRDNWDLRFPQPEVGCLEMSWVAPGGLQAEARFCIWDLGVISEAGLFPPWTACG